MNAILTYSEIELKIDNLKNEIEFYNTILLTFCGNTNGIYEFTKKLNICKDEIRRYNSLLNKESHNQLKMSLDYTIGNCIKCNDEINNNDEIDSDYYEIDSEYYCQDCYNENFYTCKNCNDVIPQDESYYHDNSIYCQDCYDDNFCNCASCDNVIKINDSENVDSEYYCQDCYNENFITCYNCSDVIPIDNSYYSERNEEYYCQDCYNQCDDEISCFDSTRINLENNTFKDITSQLKFGIELEIAYDEIDYNEIENNTCFGSVEDGSINRGSEIVSPILQGDKGYNEIKKLCAIIENYDTDSSTGFHMHIDSSTFKDNFSKMQKVWYMYNRIDSILYKLIHPNRKLNTYCEPSKNLNNAIYNLNTLDELHELRRDEYNERYVGFNLCALSKHGTIELRYKEGTTKFKDIINWIQLNLAIFDYALSHDIDTIKKFTTNINQLDRLITLLGIVTKKDYTIINYFVSMYNKYNKTTEKYKKQVVNALN